MRKLIYAIAIFTVIGLIIISQHTSYAQTCSSESDCQKLIKEYESKLGSLREQKNTLASQVQFFDTQIYLATLRIQDTEQKIKKTSDEIDNLGGKIAGLNTSLDHVSKLLIKKIAEDYKRRDVPLLSVFVDSEDASTMVNRMKYAKSAQESDQKLAFQVQQAKQNFQDQRDLREQKKADLDKLVSTLDSQKASLGTQKIQKQKLLADTQNDESTYQRLLQQAQTQLSGFKSFVQSAGGGAIGAGAFGSGSDGAYMSQRDSRWAGMHMGNSSDTVLDVGCIITSIAMVQKKNGSDYTPASIASNPSFFFSNTAYMLHPGNFSWPAGRYSNISVSDIDDKLSAGKYVIVGLNAGAFGTHYVVLIKKDGDDYIMHDPYYGPDLKFSSHYSRGSIFVVGVFL
ncbi:hypothetical protein HYS00_01415 [Candidatus Microgenomates bacterium]|nr:hypothetical protein [Candidatus Microgenomates bacterium]